MEHPASYRAPVRCWPLVPALATGPSIVPGSGQVFLVNQSRLCFHDFCIAGTGGNYDFYQPKIKNLGAPRLVTRMFAGLIKSTLPEPGSC